jgi:hypothetical protein
MTILADLLTLAQKIPATFWGVVIGAFFSLGGILLTNRAHDRRQRSQLAFDRELRNRDREFSLRRDVYLEASEAISAGLIAVGRFGNLEIPNDKVTEGYTDKAPSIAKVHVIAREQTARVVMELVGELSATYMRLFAKRAPLIVQKQQLDLLNERVQRYSRERDRTLEQMKQHNLDGAQDQRRWGVLQSNFDFEQHRVTEAAEQSAVLARNLFPKQMTYAEECIAETAKLGRLSVPVLVSIRSELELPINEVEYRTVIEDAMKKQEAALKEFVQAVRAFVDTQPAAAGDAPQAPRP